MKSTIFRSIAYSAALLLVLLTMSSIPAVTAQAGEIEAEPERPIYDLVERSLMPGSRQQKRIMHPRIGEIAPSLPTVRIQLSRKSEAVISGISMLETIWE